MFRTQMHELVFVFGFQYIELLQVHFRLPSVIWSHAHDMIINEENGVAPVFPSLYMYENDF